MKVPLLDLRAQYAPLREEIRAAMDEVCDSQMFILGKSVADFEKAITEYCQCAHACGVRSYRSAPSAMLMPLVYAKLRRSASTHVTRVLWIRSSASLRVYASFVPTVLTFFCYLPCTDDPQLCSTCPG